MMANSGASHAQKRVSFANKAARGASLSVVRWWQRYSEARLPWHGNSGASRLTLRHRRGSQGR
jgi:hypothetical protein